MPPGPPRLGGHNDIVQMLRNKILTNKENYEEEVAEDIDREEDRARKSKRRRIKTYEEEVDRIYGQRRGPGKKIVKLDEGSQYLPRGLLSTRLG